VRLVGPAGEQIGIVAINDALRLAQESDLDLVEVAPNARPPVAKLMDYGKFKYESALKARESRKNQAQTVIKEIKLRPKIDPHDYGTKKGHVERFLKAGDKVKVTIMFRGREQSRPELGFKLLQRLAGDVEELGFVESAPKQDGRNMIMVIGPHKRKAEPRPEVGTQHSEARAERAQRVAARAAANGTSAPADDGPDDLEDELTGFVIEVSEPEQAAEPEPAEVPAAEESPRPAARPAAQAAPRPAAARPASSAAPRPAAPRPATSASGARPAAPGSSPRPSAPGSAPRPAPPRPGPRPSAPGGQATGSSAPAAGSGATPRPSAPQTGTPRPSAPRPAPPRPGAPRPSAPRPRPAAPVPAQRGESASGTAKPAEPAD
jgi:translation initiation factor IF-3